MIDNFVGGYLNFLVVFLCLMYFSPVTALIALAGAVASFMFLLLVSSYSTQNAPVEAMAGQNLSESVLEYVHGLPTVKSFGQGGASMQAMRTAARENRDIRLKIEYGFTPANCGHLLMLKIASVALAGAACYMGRTGAMEFPVMLMFVFFSFSIFASLEPISDTAHVLGIIDTETMIPATTAYMIPNTTLFMIGIRISHPASAPTGSARPDSKEYQKAFDLEHVD